MEQVVEGVEAPTKPKPKKTSTSARVDHVWFNKKYITPIVRKYFTYEHLHTNSGKTKYTSKYYIAERDPSNTGSYLSNTACLRAVIGELEKIDGSVGVRLSPIKSPLFDAEQRLTKKEKRFQKYIDGRRKNCSASLDNLYIDLDPKMVEAAYVREVLRKEDPPKKVPTPQQSQPKPTKLVTVTISLEDYNEWRTIWAKLGELPPCKGLTVAKLEQLITELKDVRHQLETNNRIFNKVRKAVNSVN